MIFGMDYLGGAAYPDLILKEHPAGWWAGGFDLEFGDFLNKVAIPLALTGRCPGFRIQLLWDDKHSYTSLDLPTIANRARKWQAFKLRFPNVQVELSTFCEHTLSNPDTFHATTAKNAPSCVIVNSPLKNGALSKVYKNEFHGAEKTPRRSTTHINFSFDGTAAVDADVSTYKRNYGACDVFFFWDAPFNLHTEVGSSARNFKPTSTLIDSIIYLKNDRGAIRLPAKWLWKSHSEQKGTSDPRADKPVLITPLKTTYIYLKARNGQTVETMKYYGTYTDGRLRYYGTAWGYQIAEKARRIQGDAVCDVWANGKLIGTLNPAFRCSNSGEYRTVVRGKIQESKRGAAKKKT